MERAWQIIGEIFHVEIMETQAGEKIEDILDWNSFMIMQLMAEVSNRYQYEISVMEIAEIETLGDLEELMRRILDRENPHE